MRLCWYRAVGFVVCVNVTSAMWTKESYETNYNNIDFNRNLCCWTCTSFAINDLPNFGEWMKTNEQQFRKPHRHDGPNQYMDKNMMDGNNHMMPQDGMGPNSQWPTYAQKWSKSNDASRWYGTDNNSIWHSNGQMPPQGQMPMQGRRHLNKLMVMHHNNKVIKVHHKLHKINDALVHFFHKI